MAVYIKDGRGPSPAILYQNADRTITLIDVPSSIAEAQGRSDLLLSTQPLDSPIPLAGEPKNQKNRDKFAAGFHLHTIMLYSEYKTLVELALQEIRAHHSGKWCKPRRVKAEGPEDDEGAMETDDDPEQELQARLREWAQPVENEGDDYASNFQAMMASLGTTDVLDATADNQWRVSYGLAPDITKKDHQSAPDSERVEEPWVPSFHNPEKRALDLSIFKNATGFDQQSGPAYHFTVPPKASFFLGDLSQSDVLRTSFRELAHEHNLPRRFNLMVMDPPWPNRSAKRHRAYDQSGGMPYIKRVLLNMDIDGYLEPNALVGVWVTNKENLRSHVLDPGGLFEAWNVALIEEWIWIKTTTDGEPEFNIDSVTRKPYEILLLGRVAPNTWTISEHVPIPKRRVIAAVPDVHSRKPCLKALLEEYLPDDYSALELFSRYLVSGWTSWGNEVLKYNSDQYWAPASEDEMDTQA